MIWTCLMPGKAEATQMNFPTLNMWPVLFNDSPVNGRRFVQFFLRLGCGKAAPDPRSQPVLLQFSADGGLTWGLLQEFLFSNSSNQARLVALEIPLRARTTSTRIRWWQPSESGHFYSPWVIDQARRYYRLDSVRHLLWNLFFLPNLFIFIACVYL